MDYKYQRRQIFGKRLKVPRHILNKVYNCTLSFNEYIEYQLDDKIPTSCIIESDRKIVERFGIEKCRKLDWELISDYSININIRDILLSIDSQTEDINNVLYELVKDQIKPRDYSSKMSEAYSDRLFDKSEIEEYNSGNPKLHGLMIRFNDGSIDLERIVKNWDLFKDKDLSYCLLHDDNNTYHIADSILKDFMKQYGTLIPIIFDDIDIYSFIDTISNFSSEEEINDYIKQYTDDILNSTLRKNMEPIKLSNDEYKEIFKYSSMADYLKTVNHWRETTIMAIMKELESLPEDYVFNMPIPFSELLNNNVLSFIGLYGLKNIVDFDNECGHFFTKNNCEMLRLMNDMYLHYASNEHDPDKTIYTKKNMDENGNYIDRPYTKDEFYEAMRRMIIYGPSDWDYRDKAPDYRDMTGEFRVRNAELFISENAPEELQKLFYTKSLTPKILQKHPEYISYLNGKDLSSCFKQRSVKVYSDENTYSYDFENLYRFLCHQADFDSVMNFISEYSDVLDIVFDSTISNHFQYGIMFSNHDDINKIRTKILFSLRNIIIEERLPYPANIPKEFIEQYPSMFLDRNAPKELQDAFYSRTLLPDIIISNPEYREFLNGIDLEVLFKYMPVKKVRKKPLYNETISASGPLGNRVRYDKINLVNALKDTFGENAVLDIMAIYGKYIEQVYDINGLDNFIYNSNFTPDNFLDEIDRVILQCILGGNMKYDESIPNHFKNNHPTLFLGENVPQDIKDKFYSREFTLKDFNDQPELFDLFENTNIACAFPEHMSWIIPLFNDADNFKTANYNRMKVISAYSIIQDVELQKAFKEYVIDFGSYIDIEKIEYVSMVLSRLSLSNSNEIFTFRKELATQILKSDNPLESLNKIEDMFIRNNIPTVGKIYSCFDILHPDFQGFHINGSMISPVLQKSSTTSKKIIVFSDLIKSSFGSNNRSVNAYLNNIEYGYELYKRIQSGIIQFESLEEDEIRELNVFCSHLVTLYNNTMKAKKDNKTFTSTGDVLKDISELTRELSPDGTLDYNLADRVIRMFCGLSGINTLEQAKEYIESKVKTADSRNRDAATSDMVLEQGDFIKGIRGITYLRNILQNGSVSKEFLGSSASSDSTPLDTDVSMIMSSDGTISEKIYATSASGYGPIWFVLKNDDRFITTRTSGEALEVKRDLSKLEVFYTGVLGTDHYGIRTGFASSDINYIVMDHYDSRVGLEIAMNGFYIPIANTEGKIVFTPKDYDELRSKMTGLSHYGDNNYTFSENLITEETELLARQIDQSNHEIQRKREFINQIIQKSLEELGLHLKTQIDGDLTEGFVELIDTGSTGRGTNKPGDGDFDFMMRLDRTIISNPSKLNELKRTILKNLGKENSSGVIATGDFRLKNVQLDSETNVDIDITFTEKTDKVTYSTDMALQDRLATIQKNDPEKYRYVIANILLAKQVLKKAGVYKPNRGDTPQGGLGGVGIENWILQNGGSFIDAARSFVEAANGKHFSEFQSTYQIWDFGDNHLAERRGLYAHDNFVSNNMTEVGYQKMVIALEEYLKSLELSQIDTETKKQ